jgi:hypothetical protein
VEASRAELAAGHAEADARDGVVAGRVGRLGGHALAGGRLARLQLLGLEALLRLQHLLLALLGHLDGALGLLLGAVHLERRLVRLVLLAQHPLPSHPLVLLQDLLRLALRESVAHLQSKAKLIDSCYWIYRTIRVQKFTNSIPSKFEFQL